MARKRPPSPEWQIDRESIDFPREIASIIARARAGESKAVLQGDLLFFSVGKGWAWVLDVADGFALCLLEDGVEQPAPLVETARQWQMDWPLVFRFEGDRFVTVDRAGEATIYEGVGVEDMRELIRWRNRQEGQR